MGRGGGAGARGRCYLSVEEGVGGGGGTVRSVRSALATNGGVHLSRFTSLWLVFDDDVGFMSSDVGLT